MKVKIEVRVFSSKRNTMYLLKQVDKGFYQHSVVEKEDKFTLDREKSINK